MNSARSMSRKNKIPKKHRNSLAKGAVFLIGGRYIQRLISIVTIAAVARVLNPSDYGVYALAFILHGFVNILSDIRVSQLLIKKIEITEDDFATAFTLSLIRSLLASLFLVIIAIPIVFFVNKAVSFSVVLAFAISILLLGFDNQRFVIFEKRLEFLQEAIRALAAQFVASAVTICLAFLWRDYWALIVGLISRQATIVIVSYILLPRWPRLGLKNWKEFVEFGGWLGIASSIDHMHQSIDRIILGHGPNLSVVGLYDRALNIISLIIIDLSAPMTRVSYAGLAKCRDDEDNLRKNYYKLQSTVVGICLPVGIITAFVANDLVRVILGPQWLDAAPILEILAPIFAIGTLGAGANSISMLYGATKSLFFISVKAFFIRMPTLLVGFWIGGLFGVVWVRGISSLVISAFNLQLASRLLNERWYRPLICSWRSLLSSGVLIILLMVFNHNVSGASPEFFDSLLYLCIQGGVASLIYIVGVLSLWLISGSPKGFESNMIRILVNAIHKIKARF